MFLLIIVIIISILTHNLYKTINPANHPSSRTLSSTPRKLINMFTSSQLGWLAALVPALIRASPVDSDIVDMNKRQDGNLGQYAAYFPDCSIDPSYSTGKSQYTDGSGSYVTSSCDNGKTTPAVVRFHCWTDLFVVNYQASYDHWQNSGQVIDCATTSTCAEMVVNLNQSCTTSTTTYDNQFGAQIQAQFPIWLKDSSVTPTLLYNHNFGGAKSEQICTSTSNQGTCTWDDKGCHAIWVAQRNTLVNGYIRRSCNTPRSGTNVPDSSKRADGYYTVGMQDFNFQAPNNRIIGCSAKCGDLKYPDATPGAEAAIPI